MNSRRIDLLDSFRFLAILSVLFYHFTIEWKDHTPYGNYFGGLFKYGYLGVEFFFVISGFVISYTLESTNSLASFWKRRFIRLFPPLLACSIITFGFARLFDTSQLFPNAHKIKNFWPTFTLTNPSIWSSLTHTHFAWINGSYWSLWVEIQLYILCSVLYFWNKAHFFRNILIAAIILSLVKYVPPFLLNRGWPLSGGLTDFLQGWGYLNAVFNIDYYILWFTLGIIFHQLYKAHCPDEGTPAKGTSGKDAPGKDTSSKVTPSKGWSARLRSRPLTMVCIGIVVLQLYTDRLYADRVFAIRIFQLMVLALFFLMIYKREYLFLLNNPLFKRIGVISYTIYLIHEVIGTLLINRYGAYLGRWAPLSLFITVTLIIIFAEGSYRYYEKRTSRWLKKIVFKSSPISTAP